MVKAQCLWDKAVKMNSSIDCSNVLVANLGTIATLVAGFTPKPTIKKSEPDC